MKNIDFLSSHNCLYLPSKSNPKVALVIDSPSYASNSFKLYNPFSFKAKVLKFVSYNLFMNFNFCSKFLVKNRPNTPSNFCKYLENSLQETLVISIYFATNNDKVVLQLQNTESEILGYLKYPINDVGKKQIKNEINAINLLSKIGVVYPHLLADTYLGSPFVLLKDLGNNIGEVDNSSLLNLLKKFKRQVYFDLSGHPRIIHLQSDLKKLGLSDLLETLKFTIAHSASKYELVFEHGDFAPWNIVTMEGQLIPFDLEFFVEDGIEGLDLIKYYFQVGKYLKNKKGKNLITFIENNVIVNEFKSLMTIFLIKEIVNKTCLNESSEFDHNLLNLMGQ